MDIMSFKRDSRSPNMRIRYRLACCLVAVLCAASLSAAGSELADAVMRGNKAAVRSLLQRKVDVNAPQVDGTTALHWAVRADDLETIDLLVRAGANVSARNRAGVMPLELAALNGNAAVIERLIKAGADVNRPLNSSGDTALMMASRSGKAGAVKALLDRGAQINAKETWADTTALMWAVSEGNHDVVKLLIERGADVNARTKFVPSATGRGFEGATPVAAKADQAPEQNASGLLSPLMFAAREGDLESARMLVAAGAQVNAVGGDGKDALGLAIFNGSYEVASFLIDQHADVNKADAQKFTPLFWAVDRRNMETAPNFPWVVTTDPVAAHQEIARCRRRRQLCRQQHTPCAHAGRFTAYRFRDSVDASRILRRHRTGQASPGSWRRSQCHIQRQRNNLDGCLRNRVHPGLQQRTHSGRTSGSRQIAC